MVAKMPKMHCLHHHGLPAACDDEPEGVVCYTLRDSDGKLKINVDISCARIKYLEHHGLIDILIFWILPETQISEKELKLRLLQIRENLMRVLWEKIDQTASLDRRNELIMSANASYDLLIAELTALIPADSP